MIGIIVFIYLFGAWAYATYLRYAEDTLGEDNPQDFILLGMLGLLWVILVPINLLGYCSVRIADWIRRIIDSNR